MTMLAIEAEEAGEISCVILPLREVQLVLPTGCVAEVLSWRAPTPLNGAPSWCAGTINWHGAVIPAVDHESLEREGVVGEPGAGRCLAVINRTTPGAAWPFYALVVHGIPRLVLVAQMDLSGERDPEASCELLRVRVGAELLVIPDLAGLERHLSGVAQPV